MGAEKEGKIFEGRSETTEFVCGCIYVPDKMQCYCGYVLQRKKN